MLPNGIRKQIKARNGDETLFVTFGAKNTFAAAHELASQRLEVVISFRSSISEFAAHSFTHTTQVCSFVRLVVVVVVVKKAN